MAARLSTGTLKRQAGRILKFSIVLPLFMTVMFPLIYGFSMHAPTPHHLKVAVVAQDASAEHLVDRLDAAAGDSYDVSAVDSAEEAKRQIEALQVRAAWDPQTNTEYVASMGSTSATQFAESYIAKIAPKVLVELGKAESAEQAPAPTVQDLVPPPGGDGLGLSLLFMGLPVMMAGFMTATGLRSNLAQLSARVAISIMAVLALAYATLATFVGYSVYAAFQVHALPIFLLMAFASFTVMLFHTGGMRVIGLYMALPTIFLLVLLGVPSSGAGMATELVPPVVAALHPWLPTPALLDALRKLLYFPMASLAGNVITLLLWFFLALALLGASFLRRPRPTDADAVPAEKDEQEAVADTPGTRAEGRAREQLRAAVASTRGFRGFFGSRRVVSDEQMQNRRGLHAAIRLPMFFAIAMPLMYLGLVHHPAPNGMVLDVVADGAQGTSIAKTLEQLPAYEVHRVDSAEQARQDMLHGRARGAFVPAADAAEVPGAEAGKGPVVLVASGTGIQAESAVTTVFAAVSGEVSPQTVDLAPTHANDRFGMSMMYLGLGGIVGSNIAGMMIGLVGRGWSWYRRLAWVLGVAAANTGLQYLISVHVVRFLPADVDWTVWPILFLMSVSIQIFAVGGALLIRNDVMIWLIGVFIMCGVPASGLLLPLDMAPDRYQILHHLVPSAVALGAIRSRVYLPEAPVGSAVLTELIWLAAALLVYLWGCLHVRRLRRRDEAAAAREAHQFDDAEAGEFEGAVLSGSPGPQTRQLQVVRAAAKEAARSRS